MADEDEDVAGNWWIVIVVPGIELGESLIGGGVGPGDEELDVARQARLVDEGQPGSQRDGDQRQQDKQAAPVESPIRWAPGRECVVQSSARSTASSISHDWRPIRGP